MKYFALLIGLSILFTLAFSTQSVRAGSLAGYVYDASDSSTGIDSASVDGICLDTLDEFHTWTNSQGYYSVHGLQDGRWRITASHPDYYPETKYVQMPYTGRLLNFYLQPRD